ncbi:MAG: glycerol-3-phosphate dehydrogenase [Planctomyces sp.]|nr:glycerol-3-phosphate dehydrogenase [Planctomyces sp.]
MTTRLTILGGGAMGTACALLLAEQANQQVSVWVRDVEYGALMQRSRENSRLLPGTRLADNILITSDIREAAHDADYLVLAVPCQFLRHSLTQLQRALPAGVPVISVIKGVENGTFQRPSQIVREILGPRSVAILSGPSHAEEIARRLPATVVASSEDLELAGRVQQMFSTERFRIYTNADTLGVEFAGALKNVIAIATGISDGLGFGDNAKSALMTRGLVEMQRFGVHFGANPMTFTGLAGMGDLITTCVSPYGRNRKVGFRLGTGEPIGKILESMEGVAEGVATSKSVAGLAKQHALDLPIMQQVYEVLHEGKTPERATLALLERPPRSESAEIAAIVEQVPEV